MSKHEYKSYQDQWLEDTKDERHSKDYVARYLQVCNEPDLHEFLRHQWHQFVQAVESDAIDDRWEHLREATVSAEQALETGNHNALATAFYSLGCAAESLQHPSQEESLDRLKAQLDKMHREFPLKKRQLQKELLQGMAKIIAERVWRNDEDQEIRLTDACHHVWPELVEVAHDRGFEDALPDKPESLKPWLREFAPDYARKAGPPRKK